MDNPIFGINSWIIYYTIIITSLSFYKIIVFLIPLFFKNSDLFYYCPFNKLRDLFFVLMLSEGVAESKRHSFTNRTPPSQVSLFFHKHLRHFFITNDKALLWRGWGGHSFTNFLITVSYQYISLENKAHMHNLKY